MAQQIREMTSERCSEFLSIGVDAEPPNWWRRVSFGVHFALPDLLVRLINGLENCSATKGDIRAESGWLALASSVRLEQLNTRDHAWKKSLHRKSILKRRNHIVDHSGDLADEIGPRSYRTWWTVSQSHSASKYSKYRMAWREDDAP